MYSSISGVILTLPSSPTVRRAHAPRESTLSRRVFPLSFFLLSTHSWSIGEQSTPFSPYLLVPLHGFSSQHGWVFSFPWWLIAPIICCLCCILALSPLSPLHANQVAIAHFQLAVSPLFAFLLFFPSLSPPSPLSSLPSFLSLSECNSGSLKASFTADVYRPYQVSGNLSFHSIPFALLFISPHTRYIPDAVLRVINHISYTDTHTYCTLCG